MLLITDCPFCEEKEIHTLGRVENRRNQTATNECMPLKKKRLQQKQWHENKNHKISLEEHWKKRVGSISCSLRYLLSVFLGFCIPPALCLSSFSSKAASLTAVSTVAQASGSDSTGGFSSPCTALFFIICFISISPHNLLCIFCFL